MVITNPDVFGGPIVSATGELTTASQIETDDQRNFVPLTSAVLAAALVALDHDTNRGKVLRLDGAGSFIPGLTDTEQAQLDAVLVTRTTTGSVANNEPIWYVQGTPTQILVDTFEETPDVGSSWIRAEVGDGVPPFPGSDTTYTLVSRHEVLFTGTSPGTISEETGLFLSGYHIYELIVPAGDPLNPANFAIPSGGVTTYTGTGLANAVQISQDNLNNIPIGISDHLSTLLNFLLSGAVSEIDHIADRVDIAEGFNFAVDYRTNAQGDINDDDHYNQDGVSIVGDNASNTFAMNKTNQNRLIALNLDIDSTRGGDGAMIVAFGTDAVTEHDFLHIDTSNRIVVRTDPTDAGTEVFLEDQGGAYVLNDTSSYWLLLEIFPRASGIMHRIIPVIAEIPDGAPGNIVYDELNDVNLDLDAISPSVIGLSRSTGQIARIDQFKMIEHTNFLSHTQLTDLIRHHINDRWVFGYARLFEGTDRNRVNLETELGMPSNSTVNGENISTAKPDLLVFQADSATSEDMTDSVVLPTDYATYGYVYVSEYDSTNAQWRNAVISTEILASGDVDVNDSIRIQGVSVMTWVLGTRTLALNPIVDEIYRVVLRD